MIVDELVARHAHPISAETLQEELEIQRGSLGGASVNDWRLAVLEGLEDCEMLASSPSPPRRFANLSHRVTRPFGNSPPEWLRQALSPKSLGNVCFQ